jgi:hypothetical protein
MITSAMRLSVFGFVLLTVACSALGTHGATAERRVAPAEQARSRRGPVRVVGHSLVDDRGPFLGLGVSYFTALWRFKNDRPRFDSDMAFLSRQGFNYYRMLSMVGHNKAWEGLEIAPVGFKRRDGKQVDGWPDYWKQLREMVDAAFDHYNMRTQITIFADAQLMPDKAARIAHMDRILSDVVRGREQKILMLEVANEAWQNGFPGDEGVADLREFAKYLNDRTKVPIAISSNHSESFEKTYKGSASDLATWHFDRDKGPDDGWKPVYDSWDYGRRAACPPAVSNEPIGPGSSVAREMDPIKLVMAAAFAYAAKLPAYVFHSGAGVFGKTRFEDMPGVDRYVHLNELLPGDLSSWERNDGKAPQSPFTSFAAGQADRYWPDVSNSEDGCVRNIGGRKGSRFVCVPIGIRPGGLTLEARQNLAFKVFDPLTGKELLSAMKRKGERVTLPRGPGGLIVVGTVSSIRS